MGTHPRAGRWMLGVDKSGAPRSLPLSRSPDLQRPDKEQKHHKIEGYVGLQTRPLDKRSMDRYRIKIHIGFIATPASRRVSFLFIHDKAGQG